MAQSRGDEVLFRCTPAIGGGGARCVCVCGGGYFPMVSLPSTSPATPPPTPLHTLHSPSLLLLRELVEQAASDASVALDEVSELLALLREPTEQLDDATCQVWGSVRKCGVSELLALQREPAERLDDATCQVQQSVGNTFRSLALI